MTSSPLADALGRALAADSGRPLVTFYDDSTGERVELSVATVANWVAKTANLVVDGLGLGPGDTAAVDLPRHWQLPVWVLGAWTAGLRVDVGADQRRPQLTVCGPGGLLATRSAGEVVAVSLRPMGAPFPAGELPPGVLDYGREVAGYGDRFDGPGLGPDDSALGAGAATWTLTEAFGQAGDLAARWGLTTGGRLLVVGGLSGTQEVLASTLVPLALGGSVVLLQCATVDGAHPGPDRSRIAALAAAERTTAVAGG